MSQQRDEFSAELLAFLHHCIDSVEQLQVLLLLIDSPTAPLTVDSLSAELRSTKASVQKRIHDLQKNLVLSGEALKQDGTVQFIATSPTMERTVRDLAELFRQRPHRVIAQIYARPPTSVQSFAEAFKIKKEEQ
ncbi:MAG: hypothetical protein ACXWR1_05170 [Bdellovibrionota bacterium]